MSRSHHTPAPDPALRRLRVALTVFFAVDGFLFAGWVVRIPAIKAQVGASAGQLGLALLGVSVGAVATMVLTGRLCRAYGSERVTVATGVLLSLSIALPPRTHSAMALGLVLLCFGISYGGMNVAMNSVAVDLVAALRRPVMSSFHAAYSMGGLTGAGIGGLLAPHLSPATHLLLLTPIGLVAVGLAGRVLVAHPLRGQAAVGTVAGPPAAGEVTPPVPEAAQDPNPDSDPAAPASSPGAGQVTAEVTAEGAPPVSSRDASRGGKSAAEIRPSTALVAVFGLIAACTAYGEGALAEWGPLHIQQDLHGGPGIAAAGYACVTLAMTLGRLSGTALLLRLGQTRALVLGGLVACSGMLIGALAPAIPLVMIGFAVTGLGLANLFPTAIARAGELTGPSGVAAASTLGYGGMLLGPPSIGFLADAFGLPTALTTVSLLAAVAAGIAWATRHSGATA
ncbi:Major Facilitator Superfamily protein [Streptomyces sp. DvalAA-14]|uniref:MFS transporter n=1 Tax=Streptomyces sp. SID4948 TaxID=2690287 RepID=UPI00081B9C06|nr:MULTISPECIES: MFS transporter [unclassified Streptomyces]SCD94573.1 Major Facilitator Superfamily protein [Streptomyces sp. DvalAA-14]